MSVFHRLIFLLLFIFCYRFWEKEWRVFRWRMRIWLCRSTSLTAWKGICWAFRCFLGFLRIFLWGLGSRFRWVWMLWRCFGSGLWSTFCRFWWRFTGWRIWRSRGALWGSSLGVEWGLLRGWLDLWRVKGLENLDCWGWSISSFWDFCSLFCRLWRAVWGSWRRVRDLVKRNWRFWWGFWEGFLGSGIRRGKRMWKLMWGFWERIWRVWWKLCCFIIRITLSDRILKSELKIPFLMKKIEGNL